MTYKALVLEAIDRWNAYAKELNPEHRLLHNEIVIGDVVSITIRSKFYLFKETYKISRTELTAATNVGVVILDQVYERLLYNIMFAGFNQEVTRWEKGAYEEKDEEVLINPDKM